MVVGLAGAGACETTVETPFCIKSFKPVSKASIFPFKDAKPAKRLSNTSCFLPCAITS